MLLKDIKYRIVPRNEIKANKKPKTLNECLPNFAKHGEGCCLQELSFNFNGNDYSVKAFCADDDDIAIPFFLEWAIHVFESNGLTKEERKPLLDMIRKYLKGNLQ